MPKDVHVLIQQTRDARRATEQAEALLRRQREEEGAALTRLQETLAEGGTTGDKITDFVIRRYGDTEGTREGVFRQLDQAVRDHGGELCLIATLHSERQGCTGLGGSGYMESVRRFYVGLLEAQNTGLVFNDRAHDYLPSKEPSWKLPTTRFAVAGEGRMGKEYQAHLPEPRVVEITRHLKPLPGDEVERLRYSSDWRWGRDEEPRLAVEVGDSAVRVWFDTIGDDSTLAQLLETLRYDPAAPTLL